MEDHDYITLKVPDQREAESLIVDIHHSGISHSTRAEINRAILAVAADNPDLVRKEARGNVLDDAFKI